MTPEQATAALERAARDLQAANVAALRRVAAEAVQRIEEPWPVLTGASQEGWDSRPTATGADVVNPVPYASDVHDGLADQLVPEVLGDLEQEWQDFVEKRITPILEGKK